jgi:hypothetical protein
VYTETPYPVTVLWIPGHYNISGNEAVDHLAKQSTSWAGENEPRKEPVNRPDPTLALGNAKRRVLQKLESEWLKEWNTGEHRRALHALEPSPNKTTLRIYEGSTRGLDTVLIRIRTEKVGTAAYRHSLKKIDSPGCTLCDGRTPQTMNHILFSCPALRELRVDHWPEGAPGSKTKLYESPDKAAVTAQFVIASKAFTEFRSLYSDEEGTKRDHNREVLLTLRGVVRGGQVVQQEPTTGTAAGDG